MKKIFTGTPHTKFIAAVSALTWTIAMANSAGAAQLQEARVTQVVNDVKLLLEQAAPRPAAISDLVRRGNAVRTGPQSRSELTFADLTITRLGANTIFSFKEGTREMNLIDGAILFQVPKGSGGATIRTVGVTAAITGTTGIAEFHPATTSHPQLSKWLCLEGTFHLYLPNGQSVELGPGKIVTSDGKSFSKVSTFDIAKLVSTSLFFTGFDQTLASMSLIMLESQNQLASSLLATTTNPLDPARIVNVTSQAIAAEETPSPSVSPTVTPPPLPPSKFGTPSVISSPAPYLITNGTVITTDPSITTNSVTDYGKIYRGQTDDGAFSLWAFGSTSVFDTALRIDNIFFADPSHLPVAVFKFESLSLTGDPTIDTSNGVPKLALIGVDGITSGPPGGTLKFTGLDLLLLATVNGSINLTSDVSFQDLHELVMYARGAGSDLTINSPISNIGILGLVAEDSIHLTNPGTMSVGKLQMAAGSDLMLQIGGSLLLNGSMRLDAIVLPGASVASGVNLTLNVTGDYTNNSATASSDLTITNRDHIGGDASIAVGATNIFTANNLDLQIDNRVGGHIGENALVNVGVSGGDINIVGDATFQILNNFRGHIGRDANIFVTTGAGGDFTANSVLALVNNHNGGAIGSGAELTFNIGGALVTQGDATFVISNLNEGPGGGTIGSLASLNMNAASISVGGFFQTFVGANGGGSIQGDAINTVNVSGDLTAQQGILVDIQETGFNQINPTVFIAGGHIGGDATVTLAAQNIATSSTATGVPGIDTMALEASIYSDGSGTIGGNAIVNVLASQNISAPGTVFFGVANDNYQGFGGGTIGGDAQVNVTAGSLSTGALFDNIYNNGGGSIGRDAIISLNLSNGFTATGNAEFAIFNPGGIVGRNASIAVNAGRMSAPSLSAEIDNSNGGNIGGNALINFDVSGDLTTQDDTTFQILNGAGTIGGNVEISLTAANITATSLLAQINNSNGGTIGGTAAINVSTTSANSLSANIDNSIGGTIGASANISLATGGDFATSVGDATFTINNTAGTITNNANLALNAGGSVSTAGELSLLLENYDESANPAGHIGGSANVSLITGENLTADFANIAINNRGGGRIDSGATLTIDIAGALTTLHNGLDFLGNPASLSLAVSNRGDNNTAGSFIGGDATLLFHSNSASIGGDLSVVISDKGGTIDGNALLNFSVTHDLTVQGESAATWQILTGDGPDVFGSPIGGTIHGNATLQVSAADLTVPAGSLDIEILNQNTGVSGPGGTIDSSANITFNLSGNLTTQADASFAIRNNYTASGPGGIGGIGGTIGQDAVLNINANSLSIGGTLDTSIHNGRNAGDNGGTIGGNATINLVVVGGITALDDSQFIGNGGGTIGSNAAITVSAASLATTDTTPGALSASINNSAGGSIGGSVSINFDLSGNLTSASDATFSIDNTGGNIGGNALINFSTSGDITSQGDATFQILNAGGSIGGDVEINLNAANITANSLLAQIDNRGSQIGTGGNIFVTTGQQLSANSINGLIDNSGGGQIGTGGNLSVTTGGDLVTTGDASFIVQNTSGMINNGGNLTLTVGGSVSTGRQLSLIVENYDFSTNPAGHIGTGGNISVTTPGDLTADSVSAAINNRNGGTIGSGVSLIFDISGALTTHHDGTDYLGFPSSLSLYVTNRYDGTRGSTIGGNATLALSADSADIDGNLNAHIGDRGGTIDGNALLNFNVAHDVTVQQNAVLQILNDSGTNMNAASPIGGTIHGTANLLLSAANLTLTAGSLELDIFNKNGGVVGSGGTIDSDANITFALSGNLTTAGSAIFEILNQLQPGGTTGGTIGGDATINVTTANVSAGVDSLGRSLDALIANQRGSIDGSAIVNVEVTDVITAQGPANFTIDNSSGGTIGTEATVNVSAANITANSLLAQIDNSNGGMIGGAANVAINIDNNVTTLDGITLQILNSNLGHIVTGADVLYSAGGTTSTTNLTEYIDNSNGGAIDNGGNITLHTVGPVMLDGPLFLDIDNFNGGTITNGADVTAHFVGDVTDTVGQFHSFNFFVVNGGSGFFGDLGGGTIRTGGNIDVTFDGNATTTPTATTGSFAAEIANDGGNIGTGGNISITIGGNATAGGSGFAMDTSNRGGHIETGGNITASIAGDLTSATHAFVGVLNNGGSIGSGTNVTVSVGGDVTTQDYAIFQILNYDDGSGSGPGTIGGDASINLSVGGNLTTGQGQRFALAIINNDGGHIGGDASIFASIGGSVNTTDLNVGIQDYNGGIILGGGDVALNVTGNLTVAENTHPLFLFVNTFNGGFIDNGGNVFASVGGDLSSGNISSGIQNQDGGTINTGGNFNLTVGGNLTTAQTADLNLGVNNFNGGSIGTGGNLVASVGGDISTRNIFVGLNNSNSGMINNGGNVNLTVNGNLTTAPGGSLNLYVDNTGQGHIGTGGNIVASIGQLVNTDNINIGVTNYDGGVITTGGTITFDVAGDVSTTGSAFLGIFNNDGGNGPGTIGRDVTLSVSAANISTGGNLGPTIDNSIGGTIGGSANVNFNLTGNLTSQGDATFQILNNDGGQIANSASIAVATGGDLTANSVFAFVNNRNGGSIGSGANLTFDVGGALNTTGDATFVISNRNDGSGGGTIGGNVSLTLSATSISGGGILVTDVSTNQGGHITGSAHNTVDAAGLLSGGTLDFEIENAGFDTGGGFEPGGTIDADAILSVTASDISTTSDYFNAIITNDGGGHIGGNATVSVVASSMDVATNAFFNILNGQNGAGTPTGSIGGNAAIDVAAATLSIGGNLDSGIDNSGGSISGMAQIIFNLAGNLTTQSDALFVINNSSIDGGVSTGTIGSDATIDLSANNISTGGSLSAAIDNSSGLGNGAIGGTIGGDATVNITATNLTANSLLAQINNTNGSIGASTEGGAVINMNVSGTATVTNDATVQILGSDGAVGGAGININGGSYNVGGTFLSYIDGNGTIAFNNINAHADVLKAGVFGTNGVLNVGGGILEANTTLKLYASGSNGVLNFLNSVTLRGSALTKILAANTINIFDNVLVTIGGSTPADVYTNHANYTGFGGNGTRTGTFAGAGAHDPQPLASAPPFGPASPVKLTIGGNIPSATAVPPQSAPGRTPAPGGNITSRTRIPPTLPSNVLTNGKIADVRRASNVINVRSSDELLSVLDGAAPGPGGKITIPPSKSTNHSKNSSRTNVPGRVNTGSRVNVDRRAMDVRTVSSSVIKHSPQ